MKDRESLPDDPACEVCGSRDGLTVCDNGGEVSLRCEDHAVGIDQAAEEAYRRGRSSSE